MGDTHERELIPRQLLIIVTASKSPYQDELFGFVP